MALERVRVVDSHTEGEPTRVLLETLAFSGQGIQAKAEAWRSRYDSLRRALCLEPRGWDAVVGCHVSEPTLEGCDCDAVFFNNVGVLGMCGHGTIGLAATLRHVGRAGADLLRVNTPAGVVEARFRGGPSVAVRNVPAWRDRRVEGLEVPGLGAVTGSFAYGGNWFFLVEHGGPDVASAKVSELTAAACRILDALDGQAVRASDGSRADHVELFGPARRADADSLNFVLCPGRMFDRSPCGTGTSAKLACLAAEGRLAPGKVWRQEGIAGGVFRASYAPGEDGRVVPTIEGGAWVTAEATVVLGPDDPMIGGLEWS